MTPLEGGLVVTEVTLLVFVGSGYFAWVLRAPVAFQRSARSGAIGSAVWILPIAIIDNRVALATAVVVLLGLSTDPATSNPRRLP